MRKFVSSVNTKTEIVHQICGLRFNQFCWKLCKVAANDEEVEHEDNEWAIEVVAEEPTEVSAAAPIDLNNLVPATGYPRAGASNVSATDLATNGSNSAYGTQDGAPESHSGYTDQIESAHVSTEESAGQSDCSMPPPIDISKEKETSVKDLMAKLKAAQKKK